MPVSLGKAYGQAIKTPTVSLGRAFGQAIADTDNGAGSVQITELTGPDLRTLTLTERALPHKPLPLAGVHRIDEGEYAGFPQLSQQALGAKEDPTEISGEWKTRFIGDASTPMARVTKAKQTDGAQLGSGDDTIGTDETVITSAAELCELLDDMRIKGQVVRMSWLHIARIGRIVGFEQRWNTAHDVEWKIQFKWIGRDEDAGMASPSSATLLDVSQQLAAGYKDVHDATDFDGIEDLSPSFADMVDGHVGSLQRGILNLESAIESRVGSGVELVAALRRAMTIATFVRDESETMIGELGNWVAPAIVTIEDAGDLTKASIKQLANLGRVDAGKAVAAACAAYRAITATRRLKHQAARQRYRILKQLDANALAIVLLADDEDLRKLSQDFYGTPDEALAIRSYNQLDGMTAEAGTLIVIPVLGATR
jgi:hypothetical protein